MTAVTVTSMKTAYLLPCACGRELEVDVSQAGSDIVCECGSSVGVPTIRQLKQLKVSRTQPVIAAATRPGWTATQGTVFSLSLLVAIVALVFAGYQGLIFWSTTKVNDPAAELIRDMNQEVDGWTPEVALGFFGNEAAQGLGTPFTPFWTEIDKVHEASRLRLIGGIIVAGVGLLGAAGAMIFRTKK